MQQQLNNLYTALNTGTLQQLSLLGFLLLMTISLLSSLFIAYLYLHFYSGRATGSQIHRAFPLLGISITAIFITIQFSLPLSLGLLGALSIVRFRTPIKEPEEIGFLMLVIAMSIATATFKLAFVGIMFVVALGALFLQSYVRVFGRGASDGTIVVSVPTEGTPADPRPITEILKARLQKASLESVSQTDRETVLSYTFQGISETALSSLQTDLTAARRECSYNVFFNRPGAL